jgi:hypothetical protein
MDGIGRILIASVRPNPASYRQAHLHACERSSSRKPFQPLACAALLLPATGSETIFLLTCGKIVRKVRDSKRESVSTKHA